MFRFTKIVCSIFFGLFYRVKITGIENIPEKGAALLCANHIGQMDMFFFGYRLKRMVHYMAKEELFRNPIISAVIRSLGTFSVKRGKADVGAVRTALKLLEEGEIVGIFPEATRTKGKNPDEIKVKPGASMIAINAGVPIIPVAIAGSYKPFTEVRVVFGKPFRLDADRNKKYDSEELRRMSVELMKKVYSLLEAR